METKHISITEVNDIYLCIDIYFKVSFEAQPQSNNDMWTSTNIGDVIVMCWSLSHLVFTKGKGIATILLLHKGTKCLTRLWILQMCHLEINIRVAFFHFKNMQRLLWYFQFLVQWAQDTLAGNRKGTRLSCGNSFSYIPWNSSPKLLTDESVKSLSQTFLVLRKTLNISESKDSLKQSLKRKQE